MTDPAKKPITGSVKKPTPDQPAVSGQGEGDSGRDQQPRTESVTWVPMFDAADVSGRAATWTVVGFVGAVTAVIFASVVAGGERAWQLAMFGIGAVAAIGLLLVCIGVGLLHGEALRAKSLPITSVTVLGVDAEGAAQLITALRRVVTALSPARLLLVLGTVMLVVAAATAVVASGQIAQLDPGDPASTSSSTGE